MGFQNLCENQPKNQRIWLVGGRWLQRVWGANAAIPGSTCPHVKCPWARHLTLIAPVEQVGALRGCASANGGWMCVWMGECEANCKALCIKALYKCSPFTIYHLESRWERGTAKSWGSRCGMNNEDIGNVTVLFMSLALSLSLCWCLTLNIKQRVII